MIIEKLGIQFHLIVKYSKVIRKYRKDFKFYLLVTANIIKVLLFIPLISYYNFLLFIQKKIRGIRRPIIHLYAITWNEEKILPFVLDYYDKYVNKIILYDNQSTDRTVEIAKGYKKVQIIEFDTNNTFDDLTHTKIKNECWKYSRGKADYVIVCDIDELLYREDIIDYLKNSIKNGYTFFKTNGYNMYSESFPVYDKNRLITEIVKKGIFDNKYSKSIVFNPNYIVEINYSPGSHVCYPWGIIRDSVKVELKLLHYKNLGIDYLNFKHINYRNRFSKLNISNEFGIEYMNDDKVVTHDFIENLMRSSIII